MGARDFVQNFVGRHAQRLAQRLVAAPALVHLERVQPRLINAVEQELHSWSASSSIGAVGPGRSRSSPSAPSPTASALGASAGGGGNSSAPSATPGSAHLR